MMSQTGASNSILFSEPAAPEPVMSKSNRIGSGLNSGGGCALKILVLLVVIAAGAFVIQRLIVPGVDAEKTRPVIVSQDVSSEENMADEESSTANLPDGAVTRAISQSLIDQADHPFDPLLKVAMMSLEKIDENIHDYTSTLVSQVQVDGVLQGEKYIFCKIRHARATESGEIPFSVYTSFLKPQASVGQEAIWVQGWNDGKLIAHANGLKNIMRFHLDPDGAVAMNGNRYPVREIGMRNLLVKMADVGNKDRQYGECVVTMKRGVEIDGQACTMLQVVHPEKREYFEFHIARIYIDDERNIPIAYEGYDWPENADGDPPLIERYYYTDLKINVGLEDEDFSPDNEQYGYPGW